jgi:predicted amidophosphoribosyltransferase
VARQLIHRLKYDGIAAAGVVFVDALAARIPDGTRALVPIPRSVVRRIRYGMDPALTLARLLARRTGLPVARVLLPSLWWPAHAGSRRNARNTPRFAALGHIPDGAVLVDDVLTTGATINGAAAASGIRSAVCATRAGSDAAR